MQNYTDNLQDKFGNAIVGARVLVTITSSGATASLYSDNAVTPLANPLTTDANGEFSFYAANNTYTLTFSGSTLAAQVTRTGVTLFDATDANAIAASKVSADDGASGSIWTTVQGFITKIISSTGSAVIGFIQSAAGAIASTVQAKLLLNAISVTEFGVVADSTNGQSVKIQSAIAAAVASGRTLVFPRSGTNIYVIEAQTSTYCLDFPSNLNVVIEPGVTLKAASGIGLSVRFIQMISASNVTIRMYGATITGIKSEYVSGADRHGIRLQNCTNIVIKGGTVTDTGGDGIYIGSVCENVLVKNITLNNARRNNMSMIGGKRITLDRVNFTNAIGTSPECGLDIEPNANTDFMEDIVVKNCYASGNNGYGYVVSPNTLPGATAKQVNVTLVDCVDGGSTGGFQINKTYVAAYILSGQIILERCVARNTAQSGFSVRNYDSLSVPVHFIDCEVIDCSATVTAARYNAPFSVWNEATDTGPSTIGNIHIIRPRIKYTGAVPNVSDFHMRALAGSVDNCSIIDPVMIGHPGTAGKLYHANLSGATNIHITDPRELMEHDGTETLQDYQFGTTHKNIATAAAVFTLGAKSVGYPDLVFVCTDANGMTITPDAGSSIRTLGAVGKSVVTTQVGARLVLRRDSSASWLVMEKIGTWRADEGTGTKTGNFTLGAAATTAVADTFISANSKIALTPTNAAAATLMSGAKSLYVSAKTASTSFTVATADATAAAGTETFDYTITNP